MRRIALTLGIIAIVLGGGAVLLPDVFHFGGAEGLIAVAGVFALLCAIIVGRRASQAYRREHETSHVEQRENVKITGADVNSLLEAASPPHNFIRERKRLRNRIRTLAINVLVTFRGKSTSEATEAVDAGTWTDDQIAASYVGGGAEESPLLKRLYNRIFESNSLSIRVQATLESIGRLLPGWEGEYPPEQRGWFHRFVQPRSGVKEMPEESGNTGHWRGVGILALVTIGSGLLLEMSGLLLGAVVGVAYIAWAHAGQAPAIELQIERELAPAEPSPGEEVDVTVRITNVGRSLPDLRLIDGVPDHLHVVEGSPRQSVTLRSASSTTLRYTVEAVQGTHRWNPLVAISRSLNGSYERRSLIESETTLTTPSAIRPITEHIPLRMKGSSHVGQLGSQQAGEGIEFQSVRDYRPGDRRTRIDWRRYAQFNELSTIEFREERATTVLLLVDAREPAYRTPDPTEPHAVEQSVEAAYRVGLTLLREGHRVGIASIAPDPLWLPPRVDRIQAERIRRALATDPSVDHHPPDKPVRMYAWGNWFRSQAPADAQIVLFSPLSDVRSDACIVRLEAHGFPVSVISPDPVGQISIGSQVIGMERLVRIAQLRRQGIPVVDWTSDSPLDAHLRRYHGGMIE